MDDVDAFLASLDQFTAPSIDAGIQRQQGRPAASHNSVSAAQPVESSQTASPNTRRRPRQATATALPQQPPTQHQRLETSAQAHSYTDVDAGAPAGAASSSNDDRTSGVWWCVRCNTENAAQMQSCAICHRGRRRVEGPRPTADTPPLPPSEDTKRIPSTAAFTDGAARDLAANGKYHRSGGSSGGHEPLVIAGPGEVACPRCTFLNPASRAMCEMCEGPLPPPPPLSGASLLNSHSSSPSKTTLRFANTPGFTSSAAAAAVVPSVSLPGLAGVTSRSSAYTTSEQPIAVATPQPLLASNGGATRENDASLPLQARRTVELQEARRETLSLPPMAVSSGGNDTDSSDEEASTSSSDEDASADDSDWSDPLSSATHDALDHRDLVRFLETMQSVRFDDLPCAAVPPTMQAKAELRPFQLQALSWLLSREQTQQPQHAAARAGRPYPDSADERHGAKATLHSVSSCAFDVEAEGGESGSGSRSGITHAESQKKHGGAPTAANDEEDSGGKPLSCLDDMTGDTLSSSPYSFASSPTTASALTDTTPSVRGGVLADYMGLGKTRTLIALCEAARAPRVDRVTGSLVESTATLIVCPASLLTQWVEEIRRCVARPAAAPLRILVYYGARKRRQTLFQVAQSYDYVLTTYQTLTHEQPPLPSTQGMGAGVYGMGTRSAHSNSGGGSLFYDKDLYAEDVDGLDQGGAEAYDVERHLQKEVGKLFLIRWARVILDEAHYIRNMRTRQSRACVKLSGLCKWVVTATPVQNSLNDLYPLLRFLEVPHFSSLQWWNEEIVRHFNQDPRHPRPVTALGILFRSILLRRTPESVVDGKPILNLPPKRIVTHTVALSREETQFYRAIHTTATAKLNALRDGHAAVTRSPLATFTTAFEMLVRCRQTCLHPYIVVAALRRCHRLPSGSQTSTAPSQGSAGGQSTTLQTQKQQQQQQQQQEAERQVARALDQFIQNVVLHRLHTKKRSEFVQELIAEIRSQKLESRECIICLDTVNRPAILPCAHVFCEECIKHALEGMRRCPLCKCAARSSDVLLVPVELLKLEEHAATASDASSELKKGLPSGAAREKEDDVGAPPPVPLDMDLTNVANWSLQLSSKTQFLIDNITHLPQDDKVVVFSSFLTYLRYAQHWLESTGVSCVLYSGSCTMKQKQTLLDRFRDTTGPNAPRVLLATTSSCGVGLNLTCANHCFLMEPSWNPGTEEQALNRIHRIGQVKAVTVTKLIADETIEQNIALLCERKRALSGYCFGDGGAGGGDGRLRTADLLALFAPKKESSEESSEEEDEEEDEA